MTILQNDIKVYQSQDNTDNDSGGGSRTSVEIVDGDINNLFPDISRIDTVSGDVGLRKVFPTVVTTNRDLYYGAHAIIRKIPTDPNVSSLLFYTDSPTDIRSEAQALIESYVITSYEEEFYLFGNHVQGSKAVTFLQRTTSIPPVIGEVYALIEHTGEEQFIRISSVDLTEVILSHSVNGNITDYTRRRIICEIEQPLDFPFTGSEFNPVGQLVDTATTYATQVANASKFYGTKPLSENALTGSSVINVDSIYEQIVPASSKQTPIVDNSALTQGEGLLPTGYFVSEVISTTQPNGNIGTAIVPNSLTRLFTTDYIDDGTGNIKQVSTGEIKGQINYKTGELSGLDIPSVSSITIDYEKAIVFNSDIKFTESKKITSGNQGLVYVENIAGIPSASDFYVDYRSNGKWYRMVSNGDGTIGNNPSIGAGQINENGDGTASISLTLGSLPDIDSTLILSWGGADIVQSIVSTNVSPDQDTRKYMKISLGQVNIDPTSFSMVINRPNDGGSHTVTSNSIGELSDTAPNAKLLGQLDFINGELFITNEVATNNDRLDPIGSANDVVIDFDYSSAGTGDVGEIKSIVASRTPTGLETAFGAENFSSGTLQVLIGENVLPESVRIELYLSTYHPTGVFVGFSSRSVASIIVLTVNNANQLIKVGSQEVYGTVNSSGQIDFTFPERTVYVPAHWVSPDLTIPESTYQAKLGVYVNDHLDQDNMTISYQTAKDLTPSGVHNITDKVENIFSYGVHVVPDVVGDVNFTFLNGVALYSLLGNVYRASDQFQVGTINYLSGEMEMNYFDDPENFDLDFQVLNHVNPKNAEIVNGEIFGQTINALTFRTSGNKLTPSSFQVRYETINGSFSATSDANGVLTGTDLHVDSYVDSDSGVAFLYFTEEVMPESIRYDAVAESSLPLDPELLGLNTVRLPVDGRVPIYDAGRHLVIFNEVTTPTTNPTPLADDVETLARSGQAYMEVIDVNGKRLNPTEYTLDKNAGTVTFVNPLTLEDKYGNVLTAPFSVVDRVEDMLLATDVSITGSITLSGVLTNDYDSGISYCASSLVWGDTGSRIYNIFSQEIWNNSNPVWQDSLDGDPTTSQFDDINYPVQIDNQSSTSGRWAIIFTNATTVTVAHEVLGVVETGISISVDDVAPINPATGNPYFTMDRNGFGAGWITNNVIRFNTDSGDNNMWVIRTVKSGALQENTDNIVLEIRGDAN